MELVVPGIDPSSKTVDADNTDYIVSDDLTFEGPYAKSKKEYVVHAVDRVLIPPAAADAARRAYATISVRRHCRRRRACRLPVCRRRPAHALCTHAIGAPLARAHARARLPQYPAEGERLSASLRRRSADACRRRQGGRAHARALARAGRLAPSRLGGAPAALAPKFDPAILTAQRPRARRPRPRPRRPSLVNLPTHHIRRCPRTAGCKSSAAARPGS